MSAYGAPHLKGLAYLLSLGRPSLSLRLMSLRRLFNGDCSGTKEVEQV